jgi:hypothetical protein
MERLGSYVPKIEKSPSVPDMPKRDEQAGLVLPDGMAADRCLADLKAKLESMPMPTLSEELRIKLGLPPKPPEKAKEGGEAGSYG